MPFAITRHIGALALTSLLLCGTQALAQDSKSKDHDHSHSHSQAHGSDKVYKGYFEDSQIQERPLSDWENDWQSVYPYLLEGTLDPVMAHKAEHGGKTAEEYRQYYQIGYKTDVDRIVIKDGSVSFFRGNEVLKGDYVPDGYEILTYKAGNRGVRYVFKKTGGDEAAPEFIQFSDHKIAPETADHYHLYWGDDRAALLEEVTNWPTYYPSSLNGSEIVQEMLAH
ncbi:ZinT family metal-binding protein [Roseibium litorale]|uniref:Metal-binding protein ZinT n=1 Tax=Roseibium litorale TaxID=2803841 RepID=A0ABR9CMY7_9HYPH|nr:metal-binding protein ZinT [Roseibium litorale]MBD8892014.1 metal-binding protein ZinT [Roseibium litorale]